MHVLMDLVRVVIEASMKILAEQELDKLRGVCFRTGIVRCVGVDLRLRCFLPGKGPLVESASTFFQMLSCFSEASWALAIAHTSKATTVATIDFMLVNDFDQANCKVNS